MKMKNYCLLFLVFFLISCTEKSVEIKSSDIDKVNIKDAYIRTTNVEVDDEIKEVIEEPKIDILSPKDGQVIKDGRIVVMLNISNFKLVTPDKYPKKDQGHVQVWIDDMEFRGAKTEFVFENESNGSHTIKTELMLSNNTVLLYSKTIKVLVNKS